MMETSIMNFIETRLTVAARRQQVISANIANVDTPGYRAQEVTFEKQLARLSLTNTAPGHISMGSDASFVRTIDAGTEVKPNGNSVDLDHELTEMTTNGLEYITLMQFLQSKLRTIRSSIMDGGS